MYKGEKISFRQQHHERPERPIGEVTLTQSEIERLRKDLAWSYKVDEKEISYKFGKIYDENGNFITEYANLIFTMRVTRSVYPPLDGIVKTIRKPIGQETIDKEIFRIKIMLPQAVRQKLAESAPSASGNGNTSKNEPDDGFLAFN